MSVEKGFTKENLDYYLKELAKEFRKRNGRNIPAEIVLVGGAAILANYGFREMTYDIDAIITASSAMKEAVNTVGEEQSKITAKPVKYIVSEICGWDAKRGKFAKQMNA